MTIDFLDKALLYLKEKGPFAESKSNLPEFTEKENDLLTRAFYRLEKDGYVYSNTRISSSGNKSVTFFISFDGLLALENCPFIWEDRPYKWKSAKEKIAIIWSIVKIVAVVVNALAVLLFTYLTYKK